MDGYAAVLKDKGALEAGDVDLLGWEKHGRRGACTNEFPERNVEIGKAPAVLSNGFDVVFRAGIVRYPPRRVGRDVTHHDHQERLETLASKRRRLAANPHDRVRERNRSKNRRIHEQHADHAEQERQGTVGFAREPLKEVRRLEHHLGAFEIEAPDFVNGMAHRNQRRDDRARARAGDVIEVVGKHEIAPLEPFAQQAFNFGEKLDGDQAANSSAVYREQLLGTGSIDERVEPAHTITTFIGRSRRMMSQSACSIKAARPSS